MRRWSAVIIASVFATGLASAQMKVQTQTPGGGKTTQLTPAPQQQMPLESARRIKKEEALQLQKAGKAVLVDVRSKDSFDKGHIKGAISIPGSQLRARLREVPPGKLIIAYCA